MTSWETEDEVINEEEGRATEAEASSAKLELFKQKHPGAYTHADINFLNMEDAKDHHRVWLALVDSEDCDWGIVEDTLGNISWNPGEGDIVGTWTRSKIDNRIHISLLSAINALEDKSIAIWAKYAEERKAEKKTGKKTRTPGVKKQVDEPEVIPELPVEEKMKFNSLRARLRKAKSG